jgi:SAM-dependent methyltransferase
MRLNVGCGRHAGLEGYTNIDVQRSPKAKCDPDIFADAKSIPLPDGCASEVMAIHLFEHFHFWDVPVVLAEWRRLLKPGGLLVLEMPDVRKCAKNLLRLIDGPDVKSLDSLAMYGLYGDPRDADPWMCHKWGWTPKTLRPVLKAHGFGAFKEPEPQWHAIGRQLRDFRIEARKA